MNRFAEELTSLAWAMEADALRGFLAHVSSVTEEQVALTIRAITEKPELLERMQARMGGRPANTQRRAADVFDSDLDIRNGVAHISIAGPMMKQVPSALNFLGIRATSTEAVRAELYAALGSDRVESIVLDIDSPGGTVDGTAALAGDVYSMRGLKPVTVRVDDLMASAALWVGAQAESIEIGHTAKVGSIGVAGAIADKSRQYENKGVKVHVLSSGELKGAGVEGSHVTEAQIKDLQRNVDTYSELFIDAVARGRGKSREDIAGLATGQVWIGSEAMDLGLVDAVDAGDGVNATAVGAIPASAEAIAAAGELAGPLGAGLGLSHKEAASLIPDGTPINAATIASAIERLRVDVQSHDIMREALSGLEGSYALSQIDRQTNAAPAAQQEQETMTEEERKEMEQLRADKAALQLEKGEREVANERTRLEVEAVATAKKDALMTKYADRFSEPAVRASVAGMIKSMTPEVVETYLKSLPQITNPDRESVTEMVENAYEAAKHGGAVTVEERSLGKSFAQSPERVRDMVAQGGAVETVEYELTEDGKTRIPIAVMNDGRRLKKAEMKKALGLKGVMVGIVFLIAGLLFAGSAQAMVPSTFVADITQTTPLTDARRTDCRLSGITKAYLMTASTTIYRGSLVLIDSSGTAIPAASSASNNGVAGVAQETKTSASTGSHWIRVSDGVICKFTGATLGQDDVGSIVYALDDQTVDETVGTNTGVAGVLVQYVSASVGWVYVSSLINFSRMVASSDPLTMSGDLTLGGGAGALTLTDSASSIVLPDNDTTALLIGSAGILDFITVDTGNNSEEFIISGYAGQDALSVTTGNVSFDADLLVAGDTTFSGGAGSLTCDTGDETMVIKDNDTSSFQIGSTDALDFLVFDMGDDSEELKITGYAGTTALSVLAGNVSFAGGFGVVAQTRPVDMSLFRIFDDYDALLTNVASDDDDMTFVQGTPGTTSSTLESMDCGGLADTTQKAAFWIMIPNDYVAGSTITISSNVGMVTTVADQSATMDFSCWVPDYANEDATVSGDLITPAAQSVNSTTFADIDFVIDDDATNHVLAAGDVVHCLMTVLCDDDGDAAGGITVRIMQMTVAIST